MWIKELKKVVGDDIVIAIVGNKIDLVKEQKITYDPQPHIEFAKANNAFHLFTSAKLNENIDELFLEISKMMIKTYDEKQNANATLNRSNSMRRRLVIEDTAVNDDNAETSSARCCGR